jgi:hypothetical protein
MSHRSDATEHAAEGVNPIPRESLIKYCAWIAMRIFLPFKEEEGAYIAVYKRLTMTRKDGKRPSKTCERLYSAVP